MNQRSAFTLIELSAVLAIIGLLIGGVMAGNYIQRQAALQSIVTDLNKFRSAYYSFKEQYGGMPGDITDAQSYWSQDPNGCPTNAVYTPRKETCNGDGNNMIVYGSGEEFRAWQQLADAGLIEGSFSGVAGSVSYADAEPGQNSPGGKISSSVYYMVTWGPLTGDASTAYYNMPSSQIIFFGIKNGWFPYASALSPREESNLDQKMDDGNPALGVFRSMKASLNAGCTTSDVSSSASYNPPTKGTPCGVMYILEGV